MLSGRVDADRRGFLFGYGRIATLPSQTIVLARVCKLQTNVLSI